MATRRNGERALDQLQAEINELRARMAEDMAEDKTLKPEIIAYISDTKRSDITGVGFFPVKMGVSSMLSFIRGNPGIVNRAIQQVLVEELGAGTTTEGETIQ